jgi:hypothetical protein
MNPASIRTFLIAITLDKELAVDQALAETIDCVVSA